MGVGDLNNQRLKTSNAVFSSFRRRRFTKSLRPSCVGSPLSTLGP